MTRWLLLLGTLVMVTRHPMWSTDTPGLAAQVDSIRRLSPNAFSELPRATRDALEERGCLIPQSWTDPTPHNVISGRFLGTGTTDWAVLCSRGGSSVILVFRDGDPGRSDSLGNAADQLAVQNLGAEGLQYSRRLAVANPTDLRTWAERGAEAPPPGPLHDGIVDGFEEKGSVVYYWDGQRWLALAGAD